MITSVLAAMGAMSFGQMADQTMTRIEAAYWQPERNRYVEWVDSKGIASDQPAFLWGMGGLLSAHSAGLKVSRERYEPGFNRTWGLIARYERSVLPGLARPDRFYDDNAWVALALMEAFEATGDRRWVREAASIFSFLREAEDEKLGGGLYWRENERTSKHTCTLGPSALVGLKLARATGLASYRTDAERWLKWLRQHLQDPQTLLFWDNIRLDGTIEKTQWSYNTALPLRCLIELGRAGDPLALNEAKLIARAATKKWIDPKTGAILDEASFAHHLADALYDLSSATGERTWGEIADRAVNSLWQRSRLEDGLFGLRWDGTRSDRDERRLLLFTASAARGFLSAADPTRPLPGRSE